MNEMPTNRIINKIKNPMYKGFKYFWNFLSNIIVYCVLTKELTNDKIR